MKTLISVAILLSLSINSYAEYGIACYMVGTFKTKSDSIVKGVFFVKEEFSITEDSEGGGFYYYQQFEYGAPGYKKRINLKRNTETDALEFLEDDRNFSSCVHNTIYDSIWVIPQLGFIKYAEGQKMLAFMGKSLLIVPEEIISVNVESIHFYTIGYAVETRLAIDDRWVEGEVQAVLPALSREDDLCVFRVLCLSSESNKVKALVKEYEEFLQSDLRNTNFYGLNEEEQKRIEGLINEKRQKILEKLKKEKAIVLSECFC